MAFKYAVDATAVWLVTRQIWSPLDYLLPSMALREPKLKEMPLWLVAGLVAWSLPFLWIGVSMTLRRVLDAGRSPWLALLFFVPLVNYVLMLALSAQPSRPPAYRGAEREPVSPASLQHIALALLVSLPIGIALVAFCTLVLGSYGLSLFLGVPFVVGAISAFVLNRDAPKPFRTTLGIAATMVLVGGVVLLLFAFEGVFCVAMALPIALPLAIAGATAGRFIALRAPGSGLHAMVVVLALPGLATMEAAGAPPLREVVSVVEVEAPPETVWRHVVTFREIPEPPAWFFRFGIAYPVRAVIEGEGAGALRRCEFSTGAFLEPITVWDAPRRLSFDVVAQPDPMRELTPYRSVHPPHLDGAFRAQRGEFRLIALAGGRTRLEGSTWYTLDMAPAVYWRPWADFLVHAIHDRVLAHVKRLAEGR